MIKILNMSSGARQAKTPWKSGSSRHCQESPATAMATKKLDGIALLMADPPPPSNAATANH